MPTKTVTITHEPWCADHDTYNGIETCGTKANDLSDSLAVWVHQADGDVEPIVELDNGTGIELSVHQAAILAESIREDGSRLSDALAETAAALGEETSPRNLTRPTETSASTAQTVVGAFQVYRHGAGEDTHFETTGDLIVELQKGGTITPTTVDRAVLVLLDVDQEPYSIVRASSSVRGDLATVEQALAHLTTVRDELRRLSR